MEKAEANSFFVFRFSFFGFSINDKRTTINVF